MTRLLLYVLKIVFLSIISKFITEFNCRDIVGSLSVRCRVGILSAEESKKIRPSGRHSNSALNAKKILWQNARRALPFKIEDFDDFAELSILLMS